MSYMTRMLIKLFAPTFIPIVLGSVIAYSAKAVIDFPATLGVQTDPNAIPGYIFALGACLTILGLLIQCFRLWRWEKGESVCYVCGHMLSIERKGRWGYFRRCLGCGKSFSTD